MKPIETVYQEIIDICKKHGYTVLESHVKYVFMFDDIYSNPLWEDDNKEVYLQSYDGIIIVVERDNLSINYGKSVLVWFDRQRKNYYCVPGEKADYQLWTDADFTLYEGENIIGVVF